MSGLEMRRMKSHIFDIKCSLLNVESKTIEHLRFLVSLGFLDFFHW